MGGALAAAPNSTPSQSVAQRLQSRLNLSPLPVAAGSIGVFPMGWAIDVGGPFPKARLFPPRMIPVCRLASRRATCRTDCRLPTGRAVLATTILIALSPRRANDVAVRSAPIALARCLNVRCAAVISTASTRYVRVASERLSLSPKCARGSRGRGGNVCVQRGTVCDAWPW